MIVGAGGHGRCCLDIAREMYDEIAFLDDNQNVNQVNDCKVVGTVNEMSSFYLEYTKIFIAVGNNELRAGLINRAVEIGYELISLISSHATVSKYASVSKGTVIFPNAVIEANASIGTGGIIAANTTINHDAVINDYCLINSNSVIRPNVELGKYTKVSSHCVVSINTVLKPYSYIEDGSVIREGE